MANGESSLDLLNEVLANVGELTNGSSRFADRALGYLNKFNQEFHSGGSLLALNFGQVWTWAKHEHPGVLILQPPYETGTVALTQGSASGTFSGAPAASQAGKYLMVTGNSDMARIMSHTAGATAFTLDAAYTGATAAAATFKAVELEYDLDPEDGISVLRLAGQMEVHKLSGIGKPYQIAALDYSELKSSFPMAALRSGIPSHYAVVSRGSDTTLRVRFSTYVTEATRVEYEFVPVPTPLTASSESIPRMLREHRDVLAHAATFKLMLDRNDSRHEKYLSMAQAKLEAMAGTERKEKGNSNRDRGRLIARPTQTGITRALVGEDPYGG